MTTYLGGVTICASSDELAPTTSTSTGDEPLRLGSLFSGFGGLELAVEQVIGCRTAWFSEVSAPAVRVFSHHWLDAEPLGDIAGVDWSQVEPVDVLCGGFPCQDVSGTGRRAGLAPGTRTGLWGEMARAIRELRPKLVVAENVMGLLSAPGFRESAEGPGGAGVCGGLAPAGWCVAKGAGLPLRAAGRVFGDLAELGFDARWCAVRASDVGAVHQRRRVFILAWDRAVVLDPACFRRDTRAGESRAAQAEAGDVDDRASAGRTAQAAGWDWFEYEPVIRRWQQVVGRPAPHPYGGPNGTKSIADPVFIEWVMGLPAGWVTDPALGLTRREQRRMLGNGVVPQQAMYALRLLLGDGVTWAGRPAA